MGFRDALGRGRRDAAGEEAYRVRHRDGAAFYTSRQRHDDLTVVVKRFPLRAPVDLVDADFVLVHGLGVSSRYFQPLAAELARRGRVWLVDLPGYGAAPDPHRDVTLQDHANAVAAMLRTSGIRKPVLVGHSMGTNVVSLVAQQDPDVADRIVLLAPTLEPRLRTRGRAIGRLLRDALREPPTVFGIAAGDYLVRCGLPYLLRQLPHLLADTLDERLPELRADVLIIDGDRDPIVPNGWADAIAARGRVATARTVHGPHVIMHTDPAMIAAHIVAFVDAADETAGAAP